MKIYFISGTDTGVGKTLASALLCRHLLKLGKTSYVKAVQTGGADFDMDFVKHVCGPELLIHCPLIFDLPASPHLAAAQENTSIDVDRLVQEIVANAEKDQVDYLVVEGAGGLSVPLNDQVDMADLCKRLAAELIIVTRSGLGTLNHTFLTVHYAESLNLPASLIISGCNENPSVIEQDNCGRLQQMVQGRILFKIPQLENLDTEKCEYSDLPELDIKL